MISPPLVLRDVQLVVEVGVVYGKLVWIDSDDGAWICLQLPCSMPVGDEQVLFTIFLMHLFNLVYVLAIEPILIVELIPTPRSSKLGPWKCGQEGQ